MKNPDYQNGKINLFNGDCMEIMKQYPDNYFDIAIVDPPYGIGAGMMTMGSGKNKKWKKKRWDKTTPKKNFWDQLFRVSKNQIIWGGGTILFCLYLVVGFFGIRG